MEVNSDITKHSQHWVAAVSFIWKMKIISTVHQPENVTRLLKHLSKRYIPMLTCSCRKFCFSGSIKIGTYILNIQQAPHSSVHMQINFFYFRIKFSIVCYRSIISYVLLARSLTRDEVNRVNFNFSFNQERWHIHFVFLRFQW